jgi:hypothetical protein
VPFPADREVGVRRNVVVTVSLVALAVGFGAGALSGLRTRTVTKEKVVRVGAGPTSDCRRAVEIANQGFGIATQSLGQARAAAAAGRSGAATGTTTAAGQSPVENILGQSLAQLDSFRGQFLQARAACESATATPSVSSSTTTVR